MENRIFSKIYIWMFVGLMISFITGYYISTNENMIYNLFVKGMYWIVFIAEFVVVIWLSAGIRKMSVTTAQILYLLYSLLTGATLASIFIIFKMSSIIFVLGITAILFLIFAAIGKYTKVDLTRIGTILIMALFGIIIASIINAFVGSETFDLALCIVGVLVFLGFIAYDIQKIKRLVLGLDEDKAAILGAFELYLDFINLFVRLIQIFGKRND